MAFGLALAVLLPGADRTGAATNIYSTRFEASEGYDPHFELAGQNGWVTDSPSFGGNGLVTNFLGSQAAFVGLFPLDPPADFFPVWRPIDYFPAPPNGALVKFSVLLAVEDSTNDEFDDFYWSVYNAQGQRLFSLDFDNFHLEINYVLDDTNGFKSTGRRFTNDVPYTLAVTMDFMHNTWSATLNGLGLVTNKPITTVGAPLNLGDIDAAWGIFFTNAPGDNFMIFDNYQITAETVPPPPARLQTLGMAQGQFLLRLTGGSGWRYAVEATTNLVQWTALKTNVISDGSFDFVDTAAPAFTRRFYRARWVP